MSCSFRLSFVMLNFASLRTILFCQKYSLVSEFRPYCATGGCGLKERLVCQPWIPACAGMAREGGPLGGKIRGRRQNERRTFVGRHAPPAI